MTSHKRLAIRAAGLTVFCAAVFGFQAPAPAPSQRPSASPARELVNNYCVSCHNQKLKTANLFLDALDVEHPSAAAESWEKVIVKLRSRAMPPPGIRRPDNATYDAVAGWLES